MVTKTAAPFQPWVARHPGGYVTQLGWPAVHSVLIPVLSDISLLSEGLRGHPSESKGAFMVELAARHGIYSCGAGSTRANTF